MKESEVNINGANGVNRVSACTIQGQCGNKLAGQPYPLSSVSSVSVYIPP